MLAEQIYCPGVAPLYIAQPSTEIYSELSRFEMVAVMTDRHKSSAKASATVKRTTSSPSVRALAESDSGDMSAADKKRNKLGYHRTAVACGHCRRRKIRCIPAADTTTSRCQNCIRLKKDCQFFPVDQNVISQPKRTRSESKGDVLVAGSDASASPPSPSHHNGVSTMTFDHFRPPVDTTHISHGSDQEYHHVYDPRPWYPSEHPPHPYWLQNDHNQGNQFVSTPYPISPTTSVQPVTSHEHAYTYPAISLDHPQYPYPAHRPRDGPISPQPGTASTFNGYRSNTLPEKHGLPEDSQRTHDIRSTGMNLPSQQMMGPPFSIIQGSPSQYAPPATSHVWLPGNQDLQHHPTNYVPAIPPQTWYNNTGALSETGGYNAPRPHLRDASSQDSMKQSSKPG